METGLEMKAAPAPADSIQPRSRSSIPGRLFDAQDADRVAATGRSADFDLLAHPVAEQCPSHSRLEADTAGPRVGLGRTDNAVLLLGAVLLDERDRAGQLDLVGGGPGFDQDVVLDDRLQLADPCLYEGLLISG